MIKVEFDFCSPIELDNKSVTETCSGIVFLLKVIFDKLDEKSKEQFRLAMKSISDNELYTKDWVKFSNKVDKIKELIDKMHSDKEIIFHKILFEDEWE